ncbi:HNH endonuclease [Kitasatospora sp. NPDC008115]|uniref:HNH endonuclease n=1 Tax=Kitasatospora sp. NPDC008115 TaxID=3364022 RepID=UPI0036ED336D
MSLADISRPAVLAAASDSEQVGSNGFRRLHDLEHSAQYDLVLNGHRHDAQAVVAAAHRYATGDPLLPEGPAMDAQAVIACLRALGFTVEARQAVPDTPGPGQAQVVLQAQGGAHGAKNFTKSVRKGVPLTELRSVLGADADTFEALFPDGIARLWGSTTPRRTNDEKAKAIRNRRVGDDLLFYTRYNFIGRARIIHLLDNPALAEAVWGADEQGAPWQHIMLLADVEEFEAPVPAEEVLASLDARYPLWSLTLRSAKQYERVAHMLPPRSSSAIAGLSCAPPSSPSLLERDLLQQLGTLRTNYQGSSPSRHQPLALAWTIARIAAGEPRLAPWTLFRSEVGKLLAEFGLPGSKVTPEYPFWHLRASPLWEVHGIPENPGPMPQVSVFNTIQPLAGVAHDAAVLLREPVTRLKALVELRNRYFSGVDFHTLLDRLGLSGYTTADGLLGPPEQGSPQDVPEVKRATGAAGRRNTNSSRIVRDEALAAGVKKIHHHRCQICGIQLQYRGNPYNQAAHIRGLGKPHDGPDELHNLLCLCPNHHVLFDGLEIYVDEDGVVRESRTNESIGPLNRHPDHPVDQEYLRYHRTLCTLNS